ncbi:MAG: histidine phosphatase family protein [Bacteroidetes bacterium]|nr:histidine phosphatase family protein [Bacteroidota bacterium]
MKKLYLIRHAKSSWEDHLLSDFDRPLSDRGKQDAPQMAEILKSKNVIPNIVISSSARRALKTAKIFSSHLNYSTDDIEINNSIYDATTQVLLNIISKIDNKYETVLMFGHNPGFTVLANLLGDKVIENMPTCSIASLELNIESWRNVEVNCGRLIGFEYPKKMDF